MGKFNRGNRGGFGGGQRSGNDRGFNRGGRSERPTMHEAVCSDCGKDCEVPFRPTGTKPVFCSNCFENQGSSNGNRFGGRDSGRSNFSEKKMFKAVCDECNKDCEVPFRPSSDKPIFCSDCFGQDGRSEKRGGDSRSARNASGAGQNNKQLEMLNNKLDNILAILSGKPVVKKIEKMEKTEKPTFKKFKKKIEKNIEIDADLKTVDVPTEVAKKPEAPKKPVAKKAPAKKAPAKKKAVAKKPVAKKAPAKKKAVAKKKK